MKKRFLQNLGFFLAANLLVKPVYVFGIDRVVQNTVGPEVYGSYFPLLNLVLIFQIFLDLGIENYTRKEIASSPGLTKRLLTNFLFVKIVLAIIFIVTFSVIGAFLPQSQAEWRLLLILLVNQSMANFILYLRANMGGLQLFKSETIISILDRTIMILTCGSILTIPHLRQDFKMEWFVLAQTFAYTATLATSLVIVLRKSGKISLRFKLASFIPIFRQLKPYAILVLLMAFYYRIDSIFLRFLLPDGKEQAGIFAHGFRIIDFMSNYALIFSFILLPTFSKMLKNKEDVSSILRLGSLALIVPAFSALSGLFFFRVEIFNVLYNIHITESANAFGIMAISFLGMCISYTFGALLTANGNIRTLNIMAIIAVALSIVLNLILIPKYKVIGAAMANATAQTFTILYHIVMVRKKLELQPNINLIFRIILFVAFSILIGFLISTTSINWLIGLAITVIASLVFSMAINLLKPRYLNDLLRSGIN